MSEPNETIPTRPESIQEIQAKSLLRRQKRIDSWFISRYGLNIYRGCPHNCTYCDGRSEQYYVAGDFGRDLTVKVNAPQVLQRELQRLLNRENWQSGYLMIGGGVGDSYNPSEEHYRLTRQILLICAELAVPVHILTKSTLVLRDLDLIAVIHRRAGAIVSMSIAAIDPPVARHFEPGVPSPFERLATLRTFHEAGIPTGLFLMPVIPYLSDTEEQLEMALDHGERCGVDFVIFSGLTLKEGRQKNHFMNMLRQYDPMLVERYQRLYTSNPWGRPYRAYETALGQRFEAQRKKHPLPARVPPELFRGLTERTAYVVIVLEHLDYYSRLRGGSSPFGYAAHRLLQAQIRLEDPIDWEKVDDIGPASAQVIREIIETGTSRLYKGSATR